MSTHISWRPSSWRLPPLLSSVFFDLLGGLLCGVGLTTFLSKAGFVSGGVAGITLIARYIGEWLLGIQLPLGMLNLLCNVPIFLISWHVLGKRFLLRTLRSLVIVALCIDFFAFLDVQGIVPAYQGDPFLAALYGGAFTGMGLALVYSHGSCTGGVDLIVMCLRKWRPHMSLGQVNRLVDGTIIIIGGLVYHAMESVLYGFLFTLAASTVVDRMMGGWISGKMVFVITHDGIELGHKIGDAIHRGATVWEARGSYTQQDREIVYCVLQRQQLPRFRQVVREHDPNALIIVGNYEEAFGTGFQALMQEE